MSLDVEFPGRSKQPAGSFIPDPRPDPNLPNANQIQPSPNLGHWPTIVFEFGNENETVPQWKRDRDVYLGWTTGVNVWIGLRYYRNNSDHTDTWWMGVAHRDLT